MQTKSLILLSQVFISMMMAFLMSGIMGAIAMGVSWNWLTHWPVAFITAWPIAFVLSMGVGPLSFKLASRILNQPNGH